MRPDSRGPHRVWPRSGSSTSHLSVHRVRWRESGVSMTHLSFAAESALELGPLFLLLSRVHHQSPGVFAISPLPLSGKVQWLD